jgi:hypothetical protein
MIANAKRPIGFTLLAIGLWWVSFGAVGAVFVFSGGSVLLVSAFLAYAAAGFIAGYALWTRKPWAPKAFLIWAGTVLVNAVLFDLLFYGGPSLRGAAFFVLSGVALWWAHHYVHSKTHVGV